MNEKPRRKLLPIMMDPHWRGNESKDRAGPGSQHFKIWHYPAQSSEQGQRLTQYLSIASKLNDGKPTVPTALCIPSPSKGKEGIWKPRGHSGLRLLGLNIQGAPKGCHNPRGDYRDQYALRVKSNQSRKKSRCPEIMRTGPELVSTAPITGEQGLFTDIEKRQ